MARQVHEGRYANASDAVRDFVRRDQDAVAQLQALGDPGESSGVVEESADALRDSIERCGRSKLKSAAHD